MIVIPRPYWSYCTDNAYRTQPQPLLVLSVGANFVLFIFVLKYYMRRFDACSKGQIHTNQGTFVRVSFISFHVFGV